MTTAIPAPKITDADGNPVVVNDVLEYLDDLRESGVTNMFDATEYIRRRFDVSTKDSRTLLAYWMNTFTERHKS